MRRAWMRSMLLLALAIGCATCAPLLTRRGLSSMPANDVKRQSSSSDCSPIEGNADFYGLGIRIGIYLQWITALLANLFSKESIDGNLETNTIFLLALFVAVAVATAQTTVQSAEMIVLLQLAFGFVFSILSIWVRVDHPHPFSPNLWSVSGTSNENTPWR